MKIVVIGGTGLIGSKVVKKLREQGHEAVAAAPSSGVNTIAGEGLARVLTGAAVVVDVSNSASFEAEAVLRFFETSTRNLLTAEAAAGVGHHIALSVVGTEQPRSRTRSSTRRSFSNSSRASPTVPRRATRCASRRCSSGPWRPTMSPLWSLASRWARQ